MSIEIDSEKTSLIFKTGSDAPCLKKPDWTKKNQSTLFKTDSDEIKDTRSEATKANCVVVQYS